MAVSAFKSTSRRAATRSSTSASREIPESSTSPNKKPAAPPRRSRSVSASSRRPPEAHVSAALDFLKRDNPLFCDGSSTPEAELVSPAKLGGDGDLGRVELTRIGAGKEKVGSFVDDRRGRAPSRNAEFGTRLSGTGRRDSGRSLSRGPPRSMSQRPVSRGHFVSSESEVEQESSVIKNYRNRISADTSRSMVSNVDLDRQCSGLSDQMKTLRTWSSQHPFLEPSGDSQNLSHVDLSKHEDEDFVGSFSEVEEKTIKAVCEQMKSIRGDYLGEQARSTTIYETVRSEVRRAMADVQSDLVCAIRKSNPTVIASSDVADIPPDLVNPGAVELVMDIRSEYAKKLEQSQERARKLRADLAVEEHRGQEISRILREILPDPRTSTLQKTRPSRRASIERRKMSKRLTEEALSYFDECVSLSAFDSSDFSSQEDPPLKFVEDMNHASEIEPIAEANASSSASYAGGGRFYDKQESNIDDQVKVKPEFNSSKSVEGGSFNPDLGSSNRMTKEGRKFQFSFSSKSSAYSDLQQDIRKYIKSSDNTVSESSRATHYDAVEYGFQDSMQGTMHDRVVFKNRVQSGNLLLCGGGFSSLMYSPFGSII